MVETTNEGVWQKSLMGRVAETIKGRGWQKPFMGEGGRNHLKWGRTAETILGGGG